MALTVLYVPYALDSGTLNCSHLPFRGSAPTHALACNLSRANMAHTRQSRPDPSLGFQVEALVSKLFPLCSEAETPLLAGVLSFRHTGCWHTRPESGLDSLICIIFARQRKGGVRVEGRVSEVLVAVLVSVEP